MILKKETFDYQGQELISRTTIEKPYKQGALFENQGCFLYFKEPGIKIITADADDITFEAQEAVLLRCGTYFFDLIDNIQSKTVEVLAVHLYPDLLKKLYSNELPAIIEKSKAQRGSQVIAPQNVIGKFIESLEFYFDNPILVNEDLLELKIKELILLLIQTKNVDSILELVSDLYTPRAVQLKKVIEQHQYSNLSVEELAHLSKLSLSSFKREFKKTFNDTPQNHINAKKLEKAQGLLRNTDLHINEIAFDCGFNDPLYFTRLFKKNMGVSPTAFRAGL